MSSPKLLLSFAKQIFTQRFIFFTCLFSAFFLCISIILINLPNFISIVTAPYAFLSKVRLLLILFIGGFQSISGNDLMLLIIISILFGINLGLVVKKYRFVTKQPNIHLAIGSGIISLTAAGCASCGLSIVSLVGLGGALAILPFGGVELYILSLTILLASLFYNLRALYSACKL